MGSSDSNGTALKLLYSAVVYRSSVYGEKENTILTAIIMPVGGCVGMGLRLPRR